ncbi:hypothetical protein HYH03_010614 [Edaphochlamys debaryana]|uniref:Uncharacterized protein n=1 Tax=Edaphochlamys debaryana TaxID=47281 RepID=A0A835XTJ8_9CHLO|nr:hypothetical protein HYH03_010614 [Edaphochlamys debaryana]|eukprot:KAG2490937.1 hypothetical protein HYH03_010614 [Edaphochlamys debaryana]
MGHPGNGAALVYPSVLNPLFMYTDVDPDSTYCNGGTGYVTFLDAKLTRPLGALPSGTAVEAILDGVLSELVIQTDERAYRIPLTVNAASAAEGDRLEE